MKNKCIQKQWSKTGPERTFFVSQYRCGIAENSLTDFENIKKKILRLIYENDGLNVNDLPSHMVFKLLSSNLVLIENRVNGSVETYVHLSKKGGELLNVEVKPVPSNFIELKDMPSHYNR